MGEGTCYAADKRHTFQTITGRDFNFADPRADAVCLDDIAHALAHVNRYGGHLPTPYSVAEHSLHVLDCVRARWRRTFVTEAPLPVLRFALLHDAPEAYIGDMVSPLKSLLPGFQAIEALVESAVFGHFGLHPEEDHWRIVRSADIAVFAGECESLRGYGKAKMDTVNPALWEVRWPVPVVPLRASAAAERFRSTARALGLR